MLNIQKTFKTKKQNYKCFNSNFHANDDDGRFVNIFIINNVKLKRKLGLFWPLPAKHQIRRHVKAWSFIASKCYYFNFNDLYVLFLFFGASGENHQNDEFRPQWKRRRKTVSDFY